MKKRRKKTVTIKTVAKSPVKKKQPVPKPQSRFGVWVIPKNVRIVDTGKIEDF